ncbi:amino acid ABC transporter permease [Roseiarcaceae bacterium H3SJ34-1]|uniref:amino acid ABC transporter permease n=1 Tax=Terripilifer ovatus TaxID=3032367 RepID=UPI003AB9B18D|nr:amino acid ABC transporter permease [Roseiarcaceae bacterium H3SJ34-1]
MDFQFDIFLASLPSLLRGAATTASLAIVSIVIGAAIGLIGGICRVSRRAVLRYPVILYVTVMRGVPLLVTLMFLYYGLPSAGILLEPVTVAIIALAAVNGAYVTEIVRGGIQSIDPGQMRAARSLGMSYSLAMQRIILPQASRRVLPPITNESLTLLKNTALVSTITLSDLLRSGLEVMTWKANTFSPFAGVALIYLLMTLPLVWLNSFLEKRYRLR